LLYVARRPAADRATHLQVGAGAECVVRRYRLISGARPLMMIEEQFPATYRVTGAPQLHVV